MKTIIIRIIEDDDDDDDGVVVGTLPIPDNEADILAIEKRARGFRVSDC
jgi:hypothetical protein